MKKIVGILLVLAFIFGAKELILAQEKDNGLEDLNQQIEEKILEEIELDELDEFSESYLPKKWSFSELVEHIMQDGIHSSDAGALCEYVYQMVFYEMASAKNMVVRVLSYAAVFMLFGNVIETKERYITDVSFLMVYAAMMVVLLQTFSLISETVNEGMNRVISFLAAMIPAYATSLVFSGNASTGTFFYEFTFALIYVMEWMLKNLLAPGIHLFLLLQLLDYVFEEERFSKCSELLDKCISFLLKSSVSVVIGIGVVQSLIMPAKDRVAGSVILQTIAGIPGVGKITGSAGEILLGCGILIKNSVGVAALIILLGITLAPMLKVFVMQMMYRVLAAFLQPIADKRIIGAISGVGRAGELYLKLLFDSVLLFFITISMISATTSFIY